VAAATAVQFGLVLLLRTCMPAEELPL